MTCLGCGLWLCKGGCRKRQAPELRTPLPDENGRIDATELNEWVIAKADEYLGQGEGYHKVMNAGRVDGYWTVAAMLQQMLRERLAA